MSLPLSQIPVAILAGGLATRLRPITEKIPKSLVPVAGKPFLAHQLELLHSRGIRHAVLCIGYLGEMIQRDFGNGKKFDVKLDYSFDGPKLLGTGGAIKRALPKLGEEFFVLYGDSYLPMDFAPVAEAFHHSGKSGLMTVYRNEGKYDTSNVVFADGEIKVYDKKLKSSDMQHIDYGLSLALIVMSGGLIGSVLPAIPGIPLMLVAVIGHRLYFGAHSVSNFVMTVLVVLTVVSVALDFLAGMFGANKFGATWRGAVGAIVGGIVGLFFNLPGIILGPFIGATLFELLGDREMKMALKAGVGATVGMFAGIIGKFAIGVIMILLFATNVILRS